MEELLGHGLTEREARRQRLVAAIALGVGVVISAAFAAFDLLVTGYLPDAIAEAVGAVVLSVALVQLMRGGQTVLAQHAVVLIITVMVLVAVNSGRLEHAILVWPLVVPAISFLVLGPRVGWLYVAVVAAGVGVIIAGRPDLMNMVAVANAGGAFIVVILLSLWFSIAGESASRALRRAVEVDTLTGLLNRVSLRRRYDALRPAQEARGRPLGLLLMSIDGVRNDVDILVVADALRQAAAEDCPIARVGDGTFALLLPGRAMPDALAEAERLRRRLDPPRLPGEAAPVVHMGVALSEPDDGGYSGHVARVEDRLMVAKMAGRSRIVADDRMVAE